MLLMLLILYNNNPATIPLNLTYDKDLTSRSGDEWRLFFQIKVIVKPGSEYLVL